MAEETDGSCRAAGEESPHNVDNGSEDQFYKDLQEGPDRHKDGTQLLIAEHYLKKGNMASEENAQGCYAEAVKWLIKSSKQGNARASELLRTCLENEQGVNENNVEDVRWCLETPDIEKSAREAARRLFRTLNPSHMKLTKEQFLEGIGQLTSSKTEKKLLAKAAKGGAEEVSEEDFINKIVKRLQGESRPQLSALEAESSKEVEFETATLVQKITKYPTMTLAWVANYTVDTAGTQGCLWLRSIIPTNQIYMLVVFFLYSLISLDVVLWILPLLVFYVSFITMMVCTMQMFYGKKKLKDIKALADMLNRFNETIQTESAASSFTWNSLTPYLSFFVALLFAVMSLAIADRTWIPCSEFTLIGLLLTIASFFALSDKYDYLAILSIFLDNISMLPHVIEGMPRIPVLYHLVQVFAGSLYSVEIVPDLHLHFGLPSLAYLVVPLLFIRMALKDSGKGTYKVLVPHLVCFFWWRMALSFYRYSSWLGLFRATVGWASAVIFLPIFILILFIWLTVQIFEVFTLTNLLRVVTTILLLAIPAAFAFWGSRGYKLHSFELGKSKSSLLKIFMVVIFAASVIPFTFVFTPPERDVEGKYVTWDTYSELCSKPQWDKTSIAHSMVICTHLTNTMVEWTGEVKKVTVKSIDNQAESFINILPWSIANWLKCTYGEEYPKDCSNTTDSIERNLCEINVMQNRRCHLKRLNRYLFEMWVKMPVGDSYVHDVRVEASHWFMKSMMKIKEGHLVRFRAALKSDLGNVWPVLKLYYVQCESCMEKILGQSTAFSQHAGWQIFVAIRDAIRSVWNFFMAPIIVFQPDSN